jgi:hypothetical protein
MSIVQPEIKTYDRNLDYKNNPDYNRYRIWDSLTDEERVEFKAWLAAGSPRSVRDWTPKP